MSELPRLSHIYQNHHTDSTRWQHFQPRNGDVVVCTSLKSGTNWMANIVLQLIFKDRDELPSLSQVAPWYDVKFKDIEEVNAALEGQTHRRLMKTHLALDGLPYYQQLNYIVVGRDPRDVAMSWWNHYSNMSIELVNGHPDNKETQLPPCPADFHEFWRNFMTRGWFDWDSEGYPMWGNMRHTQTWWNFRNLPNILFVHFNDLLVNLPEEIARIAAFLRIDATDEDIVKIAKNLTFASMKKDPYKHTPNPEPFLKKMFAEGADTFFFKGTNGRWKEKVDEQELALYEATAKKVLSEDCLKWLEGGRNVIEPSPVKKELADAEV